MKSLHLLNRILIAGFIALCGITSPAQTLLLEQRIDSLLNKMTTAEKMAQMYNNGFMTTPINSRLGIPGFVMDDGPHGVRFETATAFPTGIAMAATWDRGLLTGIGQAMGEEFHAFGKHQQLGPCIDLARDPRAGRTAESGGEDPYLSGQIAASVIKGIQTTPVIATVKHFMVESKQSNRNTSNQIYTERWLMEHYGYNFRTAVQEGGSMSIMSSYNLINGTHAAQSPLLLHKALRDVWGFPFYVVSDWGAVHDTKAAVMAGNDICMGSDNYLNDLPGLVSGGSLAEAYLDTAVRRILRTKILAGMMDFYPPSFKSDANTPAHVAIARQGDRESIILLKNENHILPLVAQNISKIAVIGPNAKKGNLNCFGSSETTPPYSVSLWQGLVNKFGATKISYTQGCDINSTVVTGFDQAKTLASQADVVIFAGGLDDTQEGEAYSYGNDRKSGSIDLPGKQQDLINELAAVNPNIIVVLQSGGVCGIHRSIMNIKGLVYAFYGGQEAGNAIADVIAGDYNPAGRMPVTMPTGDAQLPVWDDDFTNDFGCGYRWFDEKNFKPEFSFGFGMSYSRFEYSNLQLEGTTFQAGDPVNISVDVKNNSTRDGDEVAELYLSNDAANIWMPVKELKGYERIHLLSGEKKTVRFTLTAESFYYWDKDQQSYSIFPGMYHFGIGGSSDSLPIKGQFELTSGTPKPDLRITQVFTMPRYPVKGQRTSFYALVKNEGTAMLDSTQLFNIRFDIDNKTAAWARDISTRLAPGQVKLITCADTGWMAETYGKKLLFAEVDPDHQVDEQVETNNLFSRPFEVYYSSGDLNTTDVAAHKKVWVSSVENNDPNLVGENLVDDNLGTRWSSAFSDPQKIVIDLEDTIDIGQIGLAWEAAFGTAYNIAVSKDSVQWDTLVKVKNGIGGNENCTLNTVARYVQVNLQKRSTVYGYSLYEIRVYKGPVTILAQPPLADAGNDTIIELPSQESILDGRGSKGSNGSKLIYHWNQLSGPSSAVIEADSVALTRVTGLTEGAYLFQLSVTDSLESSSALMHINVQAAPVIEAIDNTWLGEKQSQELQIYPNPASAIVHIESTKILPPRLAIYDLTGKQLLSRQIPEGSRSFSLSVNQLRPGNYLVLLTGNRNRITRKLTITGNGASSY